QEKIRKLTKNDILPMLKELRDDTLEISKSLTLPIWQEAIISKEFGNAIKKETDRLENDSPDLPFLKNINGIPLSNEQYCVEFVIYHTIESIGKIIDNWDKYERKEKLDFLSDLYAHFYIIRFIYMCLGFILKIKVRMYMSIL
ncbi:MAG: hypothetical protein IKF38_02990, partial [Clostridia bacterium]|nr:hypothetical protein [Clostridia bacterium]